MASAKLAKRTVNHSHATTWPPKPGWLPRLESQRTVVNTAPISTKKITGFLARWRGSSLRKASPAARRTTGGSRSFLGARLMSPPPSTQYLGDRSQREDREESQSGHDHDHPDEETHEEGTVGGKGAFCGRGGLLSDQGTGDGQHRDDEEEPAHEHRQGLGDVEERSVRGESGEG